MGFKEEHTSLHKKATSSKDTVTCNELFKLEQEMIAILKAILAKNVHLNKLFSLLVSENPSTLQIKIFPVK